VEVGRFWTSYFSYLFPPLGMFFCCKIFNIILDFLLIISRTWTSATLGPHLQLRYTPLHVTSSKYFCSRPSHLLPWWWWSYRNKILACDWFSTFLFVKKYLYNHLDVQLQVSNFSFWFYNSCLHYRVFPDQLLLPPYYSIQLINYLWKPLTTGFLMRLKPWKYYYSVTKTIKYYKN